MSEQPLLWLLTRSSALVALLLLTAALVLGVTATWGGPAGRVLRQGAHRWCSGLAVALIAVHVGTCVADPHVSLTAVDAVLPFAAGYRPLWLGLGTLAVDLLLAVLVTTALRRRLQGRHWRGVHVLAYAVWPLAVVHGAGAGTDLQAPVVQALTAGCVSGVLIAVVAQLARRTSWPRVVGIAAVLTLTGAALGWAVQGPLAPGWADRAAGWSP